MSSRRLVILLTALGLVLRVATLDVQSFWSDEAATVRLLQDSFGAMLRGVVDGESTPPLFYAVAWGWTHVFGTGEVAARLPSALVGTATIPVVAALAGRLAGGSLGGERAGQAGRAAVLAAALAATGPLMVWYGQEARAYALLMLLTAGSALALLRLLEAPSTGRGAAWAALAIAAMWTHHFAVFVVAGEALWVLWALRERRAAREGPTSGTASIVRRPDDTRWTPFLVPVLAVGAGALALAPLLLHQRAAGRASFIAQETLGRRLTQLPKQVLVGYDAPAEVLLTVVGLLAVAVCAAGLLTRAERPRALTVVASVAAGGVALPVLAALAGQDFVLTRNLLGVLPLGLAVLAAGAARLPARTPAAAGAAAVGVLTVTGVGLAVAVASDPVYQRDDFRAATEAATSGAAGPRLVVADAESRVPLGLYLGSDTRTAPPGSPLTVREIDVVKLAGARPGATRTTPVIPADVVPPGFTLAGAQSGDTWAVRRFVAPAPVAVDPGALAALNPGKDTIVLARPR